MWSLKPVKSPPSTCPRCTHQNSGFAESFFVASQILGKGNCENCDLKYYHNWPIGHGQEFPIAFSNGLATYSQKAKLWLAEPLINAINENRVTNPDIRRKVYHQASQVVLLNCLDSCYGHVVLKILNSWFYRDLNFPKGLIALVPTNCTWMVPEFVAEVWSVDIPLKGLNSQLKSLDQFIDQVSDSYESIQLAPVNTHPDHQSIDFSKYFQVAPFNIHEFYSKQLQLCILWREDRWWTKNRAEEMLGYLSTKYSIGWIKSWLLRRQLQSYKRVIHHLRTELPDLSIKIVGIGAWGTFPDYVMDCRKVIPSEAEELEWAGVFASSQIVLGVHGSNMLIPTALAAGYVELLPNHKIPFMSEDILTRHTPRFQTFLGRHLGVFSSPALVSRHILSMLKDFSYLYTNTTSEP